MSKLSKSNETILAKSISKAFNPKPRYRYNWKTGEWDQLYRFDNGVHVIPGTVNPDGTKIGFSLPAWSPLVNHYRKEVRRIYAPEDI